MANVVVCCDGTWNTADQKQDDLPAPTNVVKLYNSLADTDANGRQQKYYHPGVGTEGGVFARLAGGGLGDGLDNNIKSAYKWLAATYRPGDNIFLFGFSRGAYTVRSLAGMMSRCGLLDFSTAPPAAADMWKQVDDVFTAYRSKQAPPGLKFQPAGPAQGTASPNIHFLGVWDTVGALGIPNDLALLDLLDRKDHEFNDTALGPAVQNARHAVAMDEKRQSFTPTLWTNIDDRPTVKQIWFPGVHSDVGGGYARSGLSDGALQWMVKEASDLLLSFRPGAVAQIQPDARDVRHDSDTGVFATLRALPRNVPWVDSANGTRFGASAVIRHDDPPLYEAAYWPGRILQPNETQTVDVFARQKWNETGLYLEAGVAYQFVATGQWKDGSITCGPGGTRDGKFELAEVAQMAGSLLGKAETLFRDVTKNAQASFLLTKREDNFDWFALIGVIANGIGADADGNPLPHETFLIGTGTPYTPKASGYLYGFANDAWPMYDNNNGSVALTVTRG